ncbi:MAG: GAF domain-containing protein [Chloroflexi bacterium]|nr:GAF domain-containing protein [Chloroflexota bacterium]
MLKLFRQNLRWKVGLIISVIIILVFGVGTYFKYQNQKRLLLNNLGIEVEHSAMIIKGSINQIDNLPEIQQVVDEIDRALNSGGAQSQPMVEVGDDMAMGAGSVYEIFIIDDQSIVLASNIAELIGQPMDLSDTAEVLETDVEFESGVMLHGDHESFHGTLAIGSDTRFTPIEAGAIHIALPLTLIEASLRSGLFLDLAIMGSLFIAILLGVSIVVSWVVMNPVVTMTTQINKSQDEESSAQIQVTSEDEIGQLGSALNQLLIARKIAKEQTKEAHDQLEMRMQELEQRAFQTETSAIVAREAAAIREVDELLDRVTHLISDRFSYYHTGIFLLDKNEEYAVLQAANSEGGKNMLARGHKLQVGRVGVVGYAAGEGFPRIAQDVGADVIYYDNPDMPNTRSEMALPLTIRGKVIGVLDVQSTEANAFSREDQQVLQILVDQISLAIENARLLETSQRALEDLEFLYGQQVSSAWQKRLKNRPVAYSFSSTGLDSTQEDLAQVNDSTRKLTKEINFRDKTFGKINFLREENQRPWTESDIELVDEIIEQTTLALESARLAEQIRLRSDQIQLLQEITSLAASLLDEKELLDATTQKLTENLDLFRCDVVLYDEDQKIATLVSEAHAPSDSPDIVTQVKNFEIQNNEIFLEVIRTQKPLLIYDVQNDPRTKNMHKILERLGVNTQFIIPLVVRNEVTGAIRLHVTDDERRFDDEEIVLLEQISTQVATALDVAQLFQAEQQGRQSASALLEISQIAGSSLDLMQVLSDLAMRTAQATQATRCTISMLDQNAEFLTPIVSQFADGHIDDELWKLFQQRKADRLDSMPLYEQVVQQKQPKILDDPTRTDLIPEKWIKTFKMEVVLLVPLISQNKVIGVITLDHDKRYREFTPTQIELAQTIAGQVATTIENVNLFEETFQRAERERLVAEITSKIRASNDPDDILDTAMEELRSALGPKSDQELTHAKLGITGALVWDETFEKGRAAKEKKGE